jgi:serine/threonine-protein kinase/endoribonuclease IRE1
LLHIETNTFSSVIRYYHMIEQGEFLYIALERCGASLANVIEKPQAFRELANAGRKDLPAVLYQITSGINHLHSLRIVHRDLKPQNILVSMGKDGKPRLLVSDFGLCKKLENEQSSFGATTGRAAGTSGWRAPELLIDDDDRDNGIIETDTQSGSGSILLNDGTVLSGKRATRSIDIFSLGLVYYYVLTNGSHPFDCGDKFMREVNIRRGNYNLDQLDSLGDWAFEAKNLIASMIQGDPKGRPVANDIMAHPFFWSAKKRLAFLCDVSDHFEKEQRDPPSSALRHLEGFAPEVISGDFLKALPREFVDSLGKQRKYTGTKLLDLLRALRNKRNHYEDMSESLKRSVGSLPDGYLCFWTTRFPSLLIHCWDIVYNLELENSDRFREYYQPAGL